MLPVCGNKKLTSSVYLAVSHTVNTAHMQLESAALPSHYLNCRVIADHKLVHTTHEDTRCMPGNTDKWHSNACNTTSRIKPNFERLEHAKDLHVKSLNHKKEGNCTY